MRKTMDKRTTNINELETIKQQKIIEELKELYKAEEERKGKKKTYHIVTFGCQMNSRDSEKISGILKQIGYVETDTEEADFVLYNTCTVRENANNKVYGHLGFAKKLKEKNPDMLIALCGCMMQEPEAVENIKKRYRFVDIIFGTHNIFKLAELLQTRLLSNRMVIDLWKDTDMIVEDLPSDRKFSFKAGVNIMYGCNNFCSYCIVPYVRGRERSRSPEDIIAEIKALAADGVVEIMLLGQNVNSYGKNLTNPISFAQLLKEVEKIDGIERIRFMTSHPKDLSQELIDVMKDSTKICRHLHLPLQSGSTRLLKIMNRRYTKESYLDLVERIRTAIPDISLTTDIIVGFPGETEEDFKETMDVVSKAGYESAFTFLYSKRTGTPAAAMENQVEETVAKERFDRLLKLVQECSAKAAGREEHTIQKVLVEEVNTQDSTLLTGRLSNNLLVHFKGEESLIGTIAEVYLEESKGFYYMGRLQEQ
ncbi:MAG: tRNA (N6-isopentenyl adenosine(37)-C2)-methylthiotransferase MiaB [Lachnospiraceae bacterium]|jgi:tRNA-2-methylthio-N6-dimethylallyladenosine synthase|nr:tRNA (N6-isopentenyl adenosine(37)-C2)-methylthiotransferase MiaB [Lachnospiraceae bacterium]